MLRLLAVLWTLLLDTADPPDPDDDDDQEPDWSTIRDPIAKLHSEWEKNRRLTRRLTLAEARLEERQAADPPKPTRDPPAPAPASGATGDEQLRASQLEAAFLRSIMAREDVISDVETAWTLLHARGFVDTVNVTDSGEVEGMDEALDKLLGRYPYLADVPEQVEPVPTTHGGKQTAMNKRRSPVNLPSASALAQRLPALRRGVGGGRV